MLTWKVCKLQSGEVGATNVHRSVNIELIIILNDSVYIYEMKFLLMFFCGRRQQQEDWSEILRICPILNS